MLCVFMSLVVPVHAVTEGGGGVDGSTSGALLSHKNIKNTKKSSIKKKK